MDTNRVKVYTTPIGRLSFPNLNVPRQYQGKGKFAYDTDLDIEGEAGTHFARFIESYAADYAKRVGKRSIDLESILKPAIEFKTKEEIPDTTRVHFKVAVIETKRGLWDRKPAFYRADGTPYEEEPILGGGTIAQIAFTVYEWNASNRGMSLQPEGVLIHELVAGQGTVDRSFTGLFGGKSVAASTADF